MKEKTKELINESIALEINVSKIYEIFSNTFPEEKDFWWELVIEEKNHAAILRSGKDSYFANNIFPPEILPESLYHLKNLNVHLSNLINKYIDKKPDKVTAFNLAYKLEKSAGEIHFQNFMEKEAESEMDRVFMRLNQDDKDHASRILTKMKEKEIPVKEDLLPDFLKSE